MLKKISRSSWLKYIIETLTLAFILGLFGGIVIGLLKDWKYASGGFFLPLLDTLKISINESLFVALLFLFLFLVIFLALQHLIRNIKWSCFIASTITCLPFFMFWAYRINKKSVINWSIFFERESIIFNLKLGAVFVLLWVLISIGLFLWTKWKILRVQSADIRPLGALLGAVLIFNISTYLFNSFYTGKQNSPNVIVLVIDCLRGDHLSSYGYGRNTTPNIDKFSEDGVLFTQTVSHSTFTKTSIASLFTSLYPYQHGVHRGAGDGRNIRIKGNVSTDILSEEETTLAEVLLENRFLTTAWIQQGQLASYMGFAQGFVNYNEWLGDAENINKKFVEWATKFGEEYRFLAYIHYLDLHGPYRPKPPYDTLYLDGFKKDEEKLQYIIKFGKGRKIRENLSRNESLNLQKAYYDGIITYIDKQIGLLLDTLKKEGLYDNSLIIITADHGDAFGEHDDIGHSNAPYEEVIRVPLIIKFPKSLHAGTVIERQVRLIDVMPTILDFLNIETDIKLEGFSLINYLDNNRHKDQKVEFPKYALSEIFHQRNELDALSIRTEEFKYIYFKNREDELYDLKADPQEKNNIIRSRPEVAEEFHRMLPAILAQKNQKRVETVTLDKRTMEELKALGYIQ